MRCEPCQRRCYRMGVACLRCIWACSRLALTNQAQLASQVLNLCVSRSESQNTALGVGNAGRPGVPTQREQPSQDLDAGRLILTAPGKLTPDNSKRGSMSSLINYQIDGQLALIGLASQPVNALGYDLRTALLEACEQAVADPTINAIVLYGDGLPFSAGADISEFGTSAAFASPDLPNLLVRLEQYNKPLIAAIGGLALGGGLELALACGYRIGAADCRVGLPEINLGLLPGAGGTQRLPRLIGAEPALAMIASGQPINATRAKELGLLNRLVDDRLNLLDAARDYALELLAQDAPARPVSAFDNAGAGLADFFIQYRAANQAR